MSFSNSSQVKIPLADPYLKYGKTFRVSNIYLESSILPQTVNDLKDESTSRSNYNQGFQNSYLNLKWEVIDPRDDYVYKDSLSVQNNVYISGFNVDIYENYGSLTGQNAMDNGVKIYSQSGITENFLSYQITGDSYNRNYSVEVTLTDFTGNSSKGLLTTQNHKPEFSILETGINQGFFYCKYSGLTGEGGQDISNDFQYANLYHFTGLNEGSFPGYQDKLSCATGLNGYAEVELIPKTENYIMVLPFDIYSSGDVSGVFKPQEYFTGLGFSGYVGDPSQPLMIEYIPKIDNLSGNRISGGDAYYNEFSINYNTGSDLMTSCYGVTGTGQTSGSVSGYDHPIFFDSGELFNTDYGSYNTGTQYIYDNSLSIQSGFNTGEITEYLFSTGDGFTGSGTFGSGAGEYWGEGCPKYTGYVTTGINGSFASGGIYNYGYYDSVDKTFKCASYLDIKSGSSLEVGGIYSMPKNNPNSYDIQYHSGINFQKTYEQSASYLNSVERMPAVIVNKSQLNKVHNMNKGPGWVGLKRNQAALITKIFSEDFVNQSFFDGIDITQEQSRDVEFINSSGVTEESSLVVNDIGEHWSWINSSGTEIYKYAGSGYEKTREINLSFDVKNKNGEAISSTGYIVEAPPMKINNLSGEADGPSILFEYDFEENYYGSGYDYDQLTNYNIVKMNLYTGQNEFFQISDSNLYKEFTLEEDSISIQSTISYLDSYSGVSPSGFKLLPFDTIGSGHLADAVDVLGPIKFTTDTQSFEYSLDEMKDLNTNCIEVEYPRQQNETPIITFGLQYTGDNIAPEYLGAMIVGKPTKTSVNFVLTNAPTRYGYVLSISTNQAD